MNNLKPLKNEDSRLSASDIQAKRYIQDTEEIAEHRKAINAVALADGYMSRRGAIAHAKGEA